MVSVKANYTQHNVQQNRHPYLARTRPTIARWALAERSYRAAPLNFQRYPNGRTGGLYKRGSGLPIRGARWSWCSPMPGTDKADYRALGIGGAFVPRCAIEFSRAILRIGWIYVKAVPRAAGAFSFSPVIFAAAEIQSPGYAPTRSWQQIFGGWTAASHPALSLQHNLHYTQQGLWIPVAARMTGWGSRILTAARITADNEKAMTRRNCSESMGERLIGGSSFVMPNQPEQLPPLNCPNSSNSALPDIRPLPTRAAPIYHDVCDS